MATTLDTWDEIRARVLTRDGHRCTVSRLLGGQCRGRLHVHHIVPRADGGTDEDDNLATACARHHPIWERLREAIVHARINAADPADLARARAVRRAARWVRAAGVHFDTSMEVEEELFGRWGRARALAADEAAREHLLALWRQARARRATVAA